MNALFREVPVGEWFLFRSAIYQKTALSMAVDEKKTGGTFSCEKLKSMYYTARHCITDHTNRNDLGQTI
jgi:hypothetical protein